MKQLYIIFIALILFNTASATHFEGGSITWKCLPNGQYIFNAQLSYDCNGLPCGLSSIALAVLNHPSLSSLTLNYDTTEYVSTAGCSSCILGTPGIQICKFESDSITLTGTPPDSGWIFQWTSCCRNSGIVNITNPGSQSHLIQSAMFPYNMQNTNPAYDNSPQFIHTPQNVYCTSIPQSYSMAAFDPDGDSLVYSFAPSYGTVGNPPNSLAYNPGYSAASPLPGVSQNANNVSASIDPNTGLVTFTSYTSGSFATNIKVESYKCGTKVSEIYREFMVDIISGGPCNLPGGTTNNPPTVTAPFADASGQFTLFADTVLVGDTVLFWLSFTDADSVTGGLQNISVSATSLVLQNDLLAPGAPCPLPPCATFTPNLPVQNTPFSFATNANWITDCDHLNTLKDSCIELSRQIDFELNYFDDYCPIPAFASKIISVIVKDLEPAASPTLDSMNILTNGDVELFWNTPTDPNGVFTTFYIYYATDSLGPYSVIDSISNFNQTTYTHIGAMGNTIIGYYQMSSKSSILCQTNYEAPSANRISNFAIFTGLDNNSNSFPVHIYPNPAMETLNISSEFFLDNKVRMEIRNVIGQLVQTSYSINELTQSVSINNLPDGIYYLSLIDKNYNKINKSFIKN